MNIWKLGTSGGKYSSYDELKKRNVIAQGWSMTKDLTFLFREDRIFAEHWLGILLPGEAMGIRTLTNLLCEMQTADLVLAYDRKEIKGICEIPQNFTYKYEDQHSACTNGDCEYANTLFPVKWVDWSDIESTIGHKVECPGAGGQGIHGITGSNRDFWDGIKQAWNEYKEKGFDINADSSQQKELSDIQNDRDDKIQARYQELSCDFIKSKSKFLKDLLEVVPQMILYGAPGTGKTFISKAIAAQFFDLDPCKIFDKHSSEEEEFKKCKFPDKGSFNQSLKGCWDIVQFHPNFAYEDFIGGIRPDITTSGNVNYVLERGKFKKFCDEACKNPDKKFIFIIDEINRANLSAVFGELLYTLEYRDEPVTIPNFGSFILPENVIILGTMNNVDKSLVTFDIALRRRFSFEIVETDLEVVRVVLYQKYGLVDKTNLNQYVEKCRVLNQKIQKLVSSPEQQIGHAYFLRITDYMRKFSKQPFKEKSEIKYCKQLLWDYHLAPLLEEYLGARFTRHQTELDNLKNEFTETE